MGEDVVLLLGSSKHIEMSWGSDAGSPIHWSGDGDGGEASGLGAVMDPTSNSAARVEEARFVLDAASSLRVVVDPCC